MNTSYIQVPLELRESILGPTAWGGGVAAEGATVTLSMGRVYHPRVCRVRPTEYRTWCVECDRVDSNFRLSLVRTRLWLTETDRDWMRADLPPAPLSPHRYQLIQSALRTRPKKYAKTALVRPRESTGHFLFLHFISVAAALRFLFPPLSTDTAFNSQARNIYTVCARAFVCLFPC